MLCFATVYMCSILVFTDVTVLFHDYRNALLTDPYLRVLGADGVFAIGDCATIRPDSIHKRAKELFDQ